MSKLRGSTSTFYTKETEVRLRSGYLHKSPPPPRLKREISWRRRFFILLKTDEGAHMLKYFRSEETEKPLGKIDMSNISLLIFCPETHNMWEWIHRNFRCPSACVLLLRARGRDFFLIGENSCDTNEWFEALYEVLKFRSDMLSHENVNAVKSRSWSAPLATLTDSEQDNDREPKRKSFPLPPPHFTFPFQPRSPEFLLEAQAICPSGSEESIYAVPKNWPLDQHWSSPQDKEMDEGVDGGVQDMYEDMASLLAGTRIHAEDKELSDSEQSEDSVFEDDRGDNSPFSKDASTDEKQAIGPRQSTAIEMDVCVSLEDVKKHLSMSADVETAGKRDSLLLKGDEILAVNNLQVESVEEVEVYLRKLRTNKVTLTINRLSNEFETLRA